ncbi:STAS domain-containing protein [Nonomuraea sp. NPDC049152]|uniref:STAS domain-containing protein n=1 Tax=Nonomuraea sp. NPDC049152 TaxID=3154350 RepID=UPI0033F45BFB
MTDLAISTVHHPGFSVLLLSGELDVLSRPDLEQLLDRLREGGHHRVIVDVAALTFCDAAGLRLMLLSTRRFFGAGGWFRLRGVCRGVERLSQILRLQTQVVADAPFTYVLAYGREGTAVDPAA